MLVESRKPCSQERGGKLHWPGYPCCWNTSKYDNICWKETKAWKGAKRTQNRGKSFLQSVSYQEEGKRTTRKHSTSQRIPALLSRRIYLLPTVALATSGLKSLCATGSFSPPTRTSDWQNNPDVAVRSHGMKSRRCTDPSKNVLTAQWAAGHTMAPSQLPELRCLQRAPGLLLKNNVANGNKTKQNSRKPTQQNKTYGSW